MSRRRRGLETAQGDLDLFAPDGAAPACLRYEAEARAMGYRSIAGVDEAGRGPLCGPVFVAAVILPEHPALPGLTDSKALTPQEREALVPQIKAQALAWAVTSADVAEIDAHNILGATCRAAVRAVRDLRPAADYLLTDFLKLKEAGVPFLPLAKGDRLSLSISAASVLAKVARDAHMVELDRVYPGYGLAQHKGYPTKSHRAAIARLGPCPEHRRSFRGVREHCG